jgi:predicted ATPase
VTGEADELAGLRQRLEEIAEELATLALDRLRDAARGPASSSAPLAAAERRITRARRAVERAVAALSDPDREGPDDEGAN